MKKASSQFVLTGLIAASAGLALAVSGQAQGTVTNPVSSILHTVDGQFTNGVGTGEWSDVTAAAFISSPGGAAIPTFLGDSNANSLLFGGLGRTSPTSDLSLHLLYDFLPRTPGAPISPGEIFASVTFPITLGGQNGTERNVSVLFVGAGALAAEAPPPGVSGSFFDVFVDLDLNGTGDVSASSLNIGAAAGFGPSPLSGAPHLIVELDVPLRIPAGFGTPGGPIPGNGINPATGLYDPDPAFWGAAGAGNGGTAGDAAPPPAGSLQSASTGLFVINPDASLSVAPVPEPSSAALLLAGLGFLAARRRKS